MAKHYDDLSAAMREVAEHRDRRLRDAGAAISTHRLERLHAALASEFPADMALRAAADTRDKSLRQLPMLPRRLELLLHSQLLARRPGFLRYGALQWMSASAQTFWSASRASAGFAAALALIVLTIATLHFGRSGRNDRSALVFENERHSFFETQPGGESAYHKRLEEEFLRKPGDALTLQVSTFELASLQPSLLMINRARLADTRDFERGLPLDLPIRQILMDGDARVSP
ncbi:MAG TPA: hypothetical protein VGL17_14465 [Gemmatimonadaceae bacterium]|jgi:hypothetical protein